MGQFDDIRLLLGPAIVPPEGGKSGRPRRRRKKGQARSELAAQEFDWQEKPWWECQTNILEIQSGGIIPGGELWGTDREWVFIDAVTTAGSRKLVGVFRTGGDPQSDDRPAVTKARWFCGGQATFDLSLMPTRVEDESNPPTPEAVFAALRNQGEHLAFRKAILAAETIKFDPPQVADVLGLLRGYILGHRSTSDPDVVVFVTSAVRSYVALLPSARLDEVAGLIDVTGPPEVFESEVAKMVVRKLTANPPDQDNAYPALADQLSGLADAYLHPRLLARPYCGATALNSVLGVALLRTSRWPVVYAKIEGLTAGWFRQQLGRRAGRLADELAARFPADRVAAPRTALQQLIDFSKA